MFSFMIYIFVILVIISYYKKSNKSNFYYNKLNSYFDKVYSIYKDSKISLYSADKDAENFLIEISTTSAPITLSDVMYLISMAQKKHIHNKIIITDIPLEDKIKNSKTFKETDIVVWDSKILNNLVKDTNAELKTSDTSNDVCDIDPNSNDPIKDGAFATHGIFSIFNDKVEHL